MASIYVGTKPVRCGKCGNTQRNNTNTTFTCSEAGGPCVVMGYTMVQYEGEKRPCSFCSTVTHNQPTGKRNWIVCNKPSCQIAAKAQEGRVYAGLVDCEETRRDALDWVQAGGMLQ